MWLRESCFVSKIIFVVKLLSHKCGENDNDDDDDGRRVPSSSIHSVYEMTKIASTGAYNDRKIIVSFTWKWTMNRTMHEFLSLVLSSKAGNRQYGRGIELRICPRFNEPRRIRIPWFPTTFYRLHSIYTHTHGEPERTNERALQFCCELILDVFLFLLWLLLLFLGWKCFRFWSASAIHTRVSQSFTGCSAVTVVLVVLLLLIFLSFQFTRFTQC